MTAQNADYVRPIADKVAEQVRLKKGGEVVRYTRAVMQEFLAVLGSELRTIHWERGGYCNECGGNYPCLTLRALARYDGSGAA